MNVLFVFAHQDDEVAASRSIVRHVENGDAVHCVYLTNGETANVTAATRNLETRRALQSLGVDERNISFFGDRLQIGNGHLFENLEAADRELGQYVSKELKGSIHRLYILAWEGGHHDHDAAHLVGLALACDNRIVSETRQIALYHGQGVPGRLFRVMSPLRGTVVETLRFSALDGLRSALLPRFYPSQRTTWLGLLPGTAFRYLILRRVRLVHARVRAVSEAPHGGALLYERMGRIPYSQFRKTTATFIKERLEHHFEPSRGAERSVPNSLDRAI